jgi:hypothetical protein
MNIHLLNNIIPINFIYNQIKKERKNSFQDINNQKKELFNNIFYFIGFFLTGLALYLSFKCNNGFHLGSVLVAFFFSPIYLIYRLAVPCVVDGNS